MIESLCFFTWQLSLPPSSYPAQRKFSLYIISFLPADLNQSWHRSADITCTLTSWRMDGVVATPIKIIKSVRDWNLAIASSIVKFNFLGHLNVLMKNELPCCVLPHPMTLAYWWTNECWKAGKQTGEICSLNTTSSWSLTKATSFRKLAGL